MHSELASAHVLIMLYKYCWISSCFTVCIQPHSEQEWGVIKAEGQLWLMVLPCYQVRYVSLNIHRRDLIPEPLRKYQEEQRLAEDLWTQQGALPLSSGQYWARCLWALEHPRGLEWKGCRMPACPSRELIMAFWKWTKSFHFVKCSQKHFHFLCLLGKLIILAVKISVRSRDGWGEIKP